MIRLPTIRMILRDGYSLDKGFHVRRRISIKTSLPYYYSNRMLPTVTVEELDEMVKNCKDVKHQQQIVEANLRLAISIASLSAAKYPSKMDDIAGVAFLSLVKAVKRFFEIENHDFSIRPYIVTYVGNRLKDYLAQDNLIRMPARTFFEKVEKGTIDSLNVSVDTGIDVINVIQDVISRLTPRKANALAVNMDSETDVRDIMDVVLSNEEDRRILELKIIGCTDKEIVTDLQRSVNKKRSVSFVHNKRTDLVDQIKLLIG